MVRRSETLLVSLRLVTKALLWEIAFELGHYLILESFLAHSQLLQAASGHVLRNATNIVGAVNEPRNSAAAMHKKAT